MERRTNGDLTSVQDRLACDIQRVLYQGGAKKLQILGRVLSAPVLAFYLPSTQPAVLDGRGLGRTLRAKLDVVLCEDVIGQHGRGNVDPKIRQR